jgi:rubrerythrin
MITDKEFKKNFIKIITSEDQAIGIYQAELFWKRRPRDVFKTILKDEIKHEEQLLNFLYSRGWRFTLMQKSIMNFNRYSGWFIGTLLSVLPRRLCFFFHYMAEKQAANGYNDLMINIKNTHGQQWVNSSSIKVDIQKIIDNEKLHSEIFRALIH